MNHVWTINVVVLVLVSLPHPLHRSRTAPSDFPASGTYEAYLQRNIDMLADFRIPLFRFGHCADFGCESNSLTHSCCTLSQLSHFYAQFAQVQGSDCLWSNFVPMHWFPLPWRAVLPQDETSQLHQCHSGAYLEAVGMLWISSASRSQGGWMNISVLQDGDRQFCGSQRIADRFVPLQDHKHLWIFIFFGWSR